MHIWQRPWLYRWWVVGGLAAVVFVVVRVGLSTQPGDDPPYAILGGAVGIYLLGIIVMQSVGLPRPGRRFKPDAGRATAGQSRGAAGRTHTAGCRSGPGAGRSPVRPPPIRRAVHPHRGCGDPAAARGLPYISGAVPQVWQPFGESGIGIPVAALPGLVIVLIPFLMLPFTMTRGRRTSDDINSPLGLTITATPRSILLPRVGTDGIANTTVGPTTLEGIRYGRPVVVDMYAGSTAVLVGTPTEPFGVTAQAGRLVAGGTVPGWVSSALSRVPGDSRWHKVEVRGGPQGIRADRRGWALDSDWLLDLWLAEFLADAHAGRTTT